MPGVNLRGSHAGTGAGRGGEPNGADEPALTSSRLRHHLPADGNASSVRGSIDAAGTASAQTPAVLVKEAVKGKEASRGHIQPARVGGLDNQEITPDARLDASVEATTGTASVPNRLAAESVEPLSRHRPELSSDGMWTSSLGSPLAGGLAAAGAAGGRLGNSRGTGLKPESNPAAADGSLQTNGSARAKQLNSQGMQRKRERSAEGISTPRLWKSRVVHLPDDHEADDPRDHALTRGATKVTFL